jgi:hypothetical protein
VQLGDILPVGWQQRLQPAQDANTEWPEHVRATFADLKRSLGGADAVLAGDPR